MKKILLIALTLSGCANIDNPNRLNQTFNNFDNRPSGQISLMKRIDSLKQDYTIQNNSSRLGKLTDVFNKYALDSLKNIKNWEVIVNEITEDSYSASGLSSRVIDFNKTPIYNLKVYSVIRNYDTINPSLDSLNLPQADVVFFTYTFPKSFKKDADIISQIQVGDTLLVSGAITHIDENLKPNFKDLISGSGASWNLDLAATEIKKKK